MEKYIKIERISDISDDKWTLLSQEIKKEMCIRDRFKAILPLAFSIP